MRRSVRRCDDPAPSGPPQSPPRRRETPLRPASRPVGDLLLPPPGGGARSRSASCCTAATGRPPTRGDRGRARARPRAPRLGRLEPRVPRRRASGGGWPQTGEDVAGGNRRARDARRAARPRPRRDRRLLPGGQLALWAAAGRRADAPRPPWSPRPADRPQARARRGSPARSGATWGRPRRGPRALRAPHRPPACRSASRRCSSMASRHSSCRRSSATSSPRGRRRPSALVLRSGDGHMEHLDPGGVAWAAVLAWLEPWGP